MSRMLFLSHGIPDNFWLFMLLYLGGCTLLIFGSFRVTSYFDGSIFWVLIGVVSGGVASGVASPAYIPG